MRKWKAEFQPISGARPVACAALVCLLTACGIDTTGFGYSRDDAPADVGVDVPTTDTNPPDARIEDVSTDTVVTDVMDAEPDTFCEPTCSGNEVTYCDGSTRDCDVSCDEEGVACLSLEIPNFVDADFSARPLPSNGGDLRVISGTIDTSSCDTLPDFYHVIGQGPDAPAICVLASSQVRIGNLDVAGTRALMILGYEVELEEGAIVRLDANGTKPGPGGYGPRSGPRAGGTDRSGGGGGGMGTQGGEGGGTDPGGRGGTLTTLEPLQGGSGGGTGGTAAGEDEGSGGGGGGALQLVGLRSLVINGRIDVGGGGGQNGDDDGGGGGAGGGVLIVSGGEIVFGPTAEIVGGGAEGGAHNGVGAEQTVVTVRADGGCSGAPGGSGPESGGNGGDHNSFDGHGGGGGSGLLIAISKNYDTLPYADRVSAFIGTGRLPTLVPVTAE